MDPPGFEREFPLGGRPSYNLLPVAGKNKKRKFTNRAQVDSFLKEQHLLGNHANISADSFNFSQKRGRSSTDNDSNRQSVEKGQKKEILDEVTPMKKKSKFYSNNLLVDSSKLDHETELRQVASDLESFRKDVKRITNEENSLAQVRTLIDQQNSMSGIVEVLSNHKEAILEMLKVVEETSLMEMLSLSQIKGPLPLADFPNNIEENWFCEVAKFAMKHSPVTASFLINLVIKERGDNIEPEHVVDFTNVYEHLAKCVTKSNNAGDKIRTLQLKMNGTTDQGINVMAKQNLCVTAETLRDYRDHFAEVSKDVLIAESGNMPNQYTIDNCDTKNEHITVEYLETETVDTSHLCNESMSPAEISNLFKPELVMLGDDEHLIEKKHLEFVVGVAVGKEMCKLRPDKSKNLLLYLPKHHKHPHSNTPITPAKIRLVAPHYYCETNNNEMISLAEDIQRQKLNMLKEKRPNDLQLHQDLIHIYQPLSTVETNEEKASRELAEYRVERQVKASGESLGHGDLMTVKMFQRAVLLRSGSVRAVDRLVYLGPFRLQLFHLCMNKTALDIQAGMKKETNRIDEGSLGQVVGMLGVTHWFSNKKKKIVRSGSYEKHAQVLQAYQLGLLGNLFDNYLEANPDAMDRISDMNSAVNFINEMLRKFGIQLYWDPDFVDPTSDVNCDLFRSSKDQILRLVVDLSFSTCEKENDSLGLRALRRLMVLYFLNKSTKQTSNYARFLLTDFVVEASASDRSKERMDQYVTVNASGTMGGGLFRDKYNEIMVQFVKTAIKKQHSQLNHTQLETLVESIRDHLPITILF